MFNKREKPSVQPSPPPMKEAGSPGADCSEAADAKHERPDGHRLSHYYFSDLYVCTDRNEATIARRLQLIGSGDRPQNGVHLVPRAVHDDIEGLLGAISNAATAKGYFEREPQVVYDGVAYRAALIGEPDHASNPYEARAPDIQTWCLRRIGDKPPSLDALRLPAYLKDAIRSSVNNRGLVLVSGSFGSGKTTTASGCLQDWVETSNDVAVTLEDPPEFPLAVPEGKGKIYQINISDRDPAEAVKLTRRYAPRYVFLGEIRTPEAARELLHMAASGPLVLCTIHASDPIQALTSLVLFASSAMEEDMAKQLISNSVSMIIHQKMENGYADAELLQVTDQDNGIKSKLRAGRYDLLYEEFDTQKIRRDQRRNAGQQQAKGGVRR